MVMRNLQLAGPYQEEVHNNRGKGGEEGRHNAANYTELYMLYMHGQVKKKLDVYWEIGLCCSKDHTIERIRL